MGYCPNHQILLYKFNTKIYSTVSNFISVLKANDEFISDKILEKQNNDDENIAKEFINQCDFDEQSSSNIKREIEKN
ncbi:MAG: hypothetical protein N2203_03070, partial [Bacteroidia bacterium]|nr:hypothetical protein [Bacteroidia bacterium]